MRCSDHDTPCPSKAKKVLSFGVYKSLDIRFQSEQVAATGVNDGDG